MSIYCFSVYLSLKNSKYSLITSSYKYSTDYSDNTLIHF